MNYRLTFEPSARGDLLEIWLYYETMSPGLGDAFEASAYALANTITDFPLMYPVEVGLIRRARIGRFPYYIFYSVTGDEIVVLAIWHVKRQRPEFPRP